MTCWHSLTSSPNHLKYVVLAFQLRFFFNLSAFALLTNPTFRRKDCSFCILHWFLMSMVTPVIVRYLLRMQVINRCKEFSHSCLGFSTLSKSLILVGCQAIKCLPRRRDMTSPDSVSLTVWTLMNQKQKSNALIKWKHSLLLCYVICVNLHHFCFFNVSLLCLLKLHQSFS